MLAFSHYYRFAVDKLAPGKCLLVDANSFCIAAAIRLGVDAIIFVDESRLKRELRMRALLKPK